MNTLAEIEEAAESLPRKQQEQLLAFLTARLLRERQFQIYPATELTSVARRLLHYLNC